jgi:tRNA (adenine22-N1)-methyltransferase
MGRIEKLCEFLTPWKSFADIGCDHGYCTQYMLKNNLCESAVISDISVKSLSKAERLLAPYIKEGRVHSVACFGLEKISPEVDEVLIAGMGGEEIIDILKKGFLPKRFVFQPMKNAEHLRDFLLKNGCRIERDDIFRDGKYYFCLSGVREGKSESYSDTERMFGRQSLKNPVFKDYLLSEIAKKESYLHSDMSEQNRTEMQAKIAYLKGVLHDENS